MQYEHTNAPLSHFYEVTSTRENLSDDLPSNANAKDAALTAADSESSIEEHRVLGTAHNMTSEDKLEVSATSQAVSRGKQDTIRTFIFI